MKAKEYSRLAKISLKSRKKTTKSTVRGIAFGLVMLVPIIFMGMGIYGDLNSKINKVPEEIYTSMNVGVERETFVDQAGGSYDPETGSYVYAFISKEHRENMLKIGGDDVQKILFEKYTLMGSSMAMMKVGESATKPLTINMTGDMTWEDRQRLEKLGSFAVFDLVNSKDGIIPKTVAKKGSVYLKDMDKGFTGDGKGQVMVNEMLLTTLGYSPSDVYGKRITISYVPGQGGNFSLDNDRDPSSFDRDQDGRELNLKLCNEYEVVGVLSQKCMSYDNSHPLASGLMFSQASMFAPNGSVIEPVLTFKSIKDENNYIRTQTYATYTMSDEEIEALNKTYMAFGVPGNFAGSVLDGYVQNAVKRTGNIFYSPLSYQANNNLVSELALELKDVFTENAATTIVGYTSSVFQQFYLIYMVFNIATLVLVIIGGIIFFAAMVNLFNTIMHSVNSRKNYLGVMRAIGAKRRVVPMLYIFESLHIFKRAMVRIILFGTLICVGLKIGTDYLFKMMPLSDGSLLTISWWYIPATFAILFAVLCALGWLFAYGCSRRIAKSPITDVLAEGN